MDTKDRATLAFVAVVIALSLCSVACEGGGGLGGGEVDATQTPRANPYGAEVDNLYSVRATKEAGR